MLSPGDRIVREGDAAIHLLKSQLNTASATAAVLSERCELWISQAQMEREHRKSTLSLMSSRIGAGSRSTKQNENRPPSTPAPHKKTLDGVMRKLGRAANAVQNSESVRSRGVVSDSAFFRGGSSSSSSEIALLEEECSRLKRALARREKDTKRSLRISKSSDVGTSEQMRKMRQECKHLKTALKTAVRQAEHDCRSAVTELGQWKRRESALEKALSDARADKVSLEAKIALRDEDMDFAVEEWKQRDAALTRAHAEEQKKLRAELAQLTARFEKMESDFKDAKRRSKTQIDSLNDELSDARSRVRRLEADKDSLSNELARLNAATTEERRKADEATRAQIDQLRADLDAAQDIAKERALEQSALVADVERLEESTRRAVEECRRKDEELASVRSQSDEARARERTVQASKDEVESELQDVSSKLRALEDERSSLEQSKESERRELVARFECQSAEIASTKRELIETRHRLEKTESSGVSERKQLEERVADLVGRLEKATRALLERDSSHALELESKDRESLAAHAQEREKLEKHVAKLADALRESESSASDLHEAHSAKEESFRSLSVERDELEKRVANLADALRESESSASDLHEAHSAKEESFRSLSVERDELEERVANLVDALRESESSASDLHEAHSAKDESFRSLSVERDELVARIAELETLAETTKKDRRAHDEHLASAERALEEAKMREGRLEDARSKAHEELCNISSQLVELEDSNAKLSQEMALARESSEEDIRRQVESARAREDELRASLGVARELESRLQDELENAKLERADLTIAHDEKHDSMRAQLDAVGRELERAENEVAKAKSANEELRAQLTDATEQIRRGDELRDKTATAGENSLKVALRNAKEDAATELESWRSREREWSAERDASKRLERDLREKLREAGESLRENVSVREAFTESKRLEEYLGRALEDASSREASLAGELNTEASRGERMESEIETLKSTIETRKSAEERVRSSNMESERRYLAEISDMQAALEEATTSAAAFDSRAKERQVRALDELSTLKTEYAQVLDASKLSESSCDHLRSEMVEMREAKRAIDVEIAKKKATDENDSSAKEKAEEEATEAVKILETELSVARGRVERLETEKATLSTEMSDLEEKMSVLQKLAVASESGASDWEAVVDENSGKTYWWNKQTGLTTWEEPVELKISASLAGNLSPRTRSRKMAEIGTQISSKETKMWKERAMSLEAALEETKRLGVASTVVASEEEGSDSLQSDKSRLEAEIAELKRQRALQVYEMGQSKMHNAIAASESQTIIRSESVEIAALRRRALAMAIHRVSLTARMRLQRRGWQKWRAVVRWCHYFWFKKRNVHFRFQVGLTQCDKVCRAFKMRRVASAWKNWQMRTFTSRDSTTATTMVPALRFQTPTKGGTNASSSTRTSRDVSPSAVDPSEELRALRSAVATREKDRRRRQLQQRFSKACHLLQSVTIRHSYKRKAKAWVRWGSRVSSKN
eukprot:g2935.t1